jgi:hypothetical protein
LRWPRALLALVPSSAAQSWSTVRSRYLFLTVGDDADPGEIPVSEMLRELGSAVQEAELVRTLPEGTLLYRARSHGRNDYPTTASELECTAGAVLDDLEPHEPECLGLTRSSLQHGPRITLASSLFAEGTGHVDDP